jgi:two-component system response regulator RegA
MSMDNSVHAPSATRTNHFLIVDDDEVFAGALARALMRRGYEPRVAKSAEVALSLAEAVPFSWVTVDLHLARPEGSGSGLHLLEPLRALLPHARIVVLTGYASIATTVVAVKSGADDYLAKPADVDTILRTLQGQALADSVETTPTPLSVSRLEWEHIQRVLGEHDGNISATARALNMHRRTLQRKLGKKPVAR